MASGAGLAAFPMQSLPAVQHRMPFSGAGGLRDSIFCPHPISHALRTRTRQSAVFLDPRRLLTSIMGAKRESKPRKISNGSRTGPPAPEFRDSTVEFFLASAAFHNGVQKKLQKNLGAIRAPHQAAPSLDDFLKGDPFSQNIGPSEAMLALQGRHQRWSLYPR
jgi:hypothetical protein